MRIGIYLVIGLSVLGAPQHLWAQTPAPTAEAIPEAKPEPESKPAVPADSNLEASEESSNEETVEKINEPAAEAAVAPPTTAPTQQASPPAPPAAPPPPQNLDQAAPIIETVMVASSSTASPPIVSAVMSDDRSGIALAEVHYRKSKDVDWNSVPMMAGTGGMFMVRLPLELAKSGFEYFVVAYDDAGNGPAQYASAAQPKAVPASPENTLQRIQRVEPDRGAVQEDNSGWLMLNLGIALISGGTSVFFWADYAQIEETVKDETLPADYVSDLRNAQVNDAFVGGITALATAASLGASIYLMSENIE